MLTDAQRKALAAYAQYTDTEFRDRIKVSLAIRGNTMYSLVRLGLVEVAGNYELSSTWYYHFRITDAGRAALRDLEG